MNVSGPTPSLIPPTPGVGSEHSDTHRSTSVSRWLSDPGRSDSWHKRPARDPYIRLSFWTVRHQLQTRLAPYQVTGRPSWFRSATWGTLAYWALLLDEDDLALAERLGMDTSTELPTPEEWFGR